LPDLDDVLKALSDNTRREILVALRSGDLSAGEVADRFDITKASISHHLNVLRQADLVDSRRDGQHIIYSLNMTVFQEFLSAFVGKFKLRGGDGNA